MRLCPDCNAQNQNDAKFCKSCGHKFVDSSKLPERNSSELKKTYCPKCKSRNIAKEGASYVCNECGNEFSKPITNPLQSFFVECCISLQKIVSFCKSIDSTNCKDKLLTAKMAIRYVLVAVVIFAILISYNLGKNVTIDEVWLMRKSDYNSVMKEKETAKIELGKIKQEIISCTDVIAEVKDFKSTEKEKQSELLSLDNQIKDMQNSKDTLTKETDELKQEIKQLQSEKEKLTGEIAKAKGKGYTLTAGVYSGGIDIPIGTYNIEWISGSGNLFVGVERKGDIVNEIFGNNSRFGYIKSYKNVYIGYGTEITINSNLKVRFKAKD